MGFVPLKIKKKGSRAVKKFTLASVVSLFILNGIFLLMRDGFHVRQTTGYVVTGALAIGVVVTCCMLVFVVRRNGDIVFIVASAFVFPAALAIMVILWWFAIFLTGLILPTLAYTKDFLVQAMDSWQYGGTTHAENGIAALITFAFAAGEACGAFLTVVSIFSVPVIPIIMIAEELKIKRGWVFCVALIQVLTLVVGVSFPSLLSAATLLSLFGVLLLIDFCWPQVFSSERIVAHRRRCHVR